MGDNDEFMLNFSMNAAPRPTVQQGKQHRPRSWSERKTAKVSRKKHPSILQFKCQHLQIRCFKNKIYIACLLISHKAAFEYCIQVYNINPICRNSKAVDLEGLGPVARRGSHRRPNLQQLIIL